jgi:flagellar FliL protein
MAAKSDDKDEAEAGEGDAAPARSKLFTLKRLIIAGAALLLIGGGGAGGYYFFFASKKEEKVAAPVPKPATFFDMPDVLVNLANTGTDRTQYLKVKIVLELPDAAMVQQIQPVLPRVMDTFQVFLRELRPTDLEGSAGTYRLKEELTRRVNTAIAPGRITAVLFKEMLVQ